MIMSKKNKDKVEYAIPGSYEHLKGKWSLAVQQYLSYIHDDTGISMEELLMKMNAVLSFEDGVMGLLFNVTEDKAYEMFIFKFNDGEDDPIDATVDDANIVNKLIKAAREDIGKAA